jgi:hypothetical protein
MDDFIKDQANVAQLLIYRLNFWIPTYFASIYIYKEDIYPFFCNL